MKYFINIKSCIIQLVFLLLCLFGAMNKAYSQDTTSQVVEADTAAVDDVEPAAVPGKKPVKNMFSNIWLIDNQSVIVPIKGSFQMDFCHRFGTWEKGYQDFFGLFGGTNIRLGGNYVPMDNLMVGVAFTEYNLTWEAYVKYSLLRQSRDGTMPVSLSYYGNMAIDTKKEGDYPHFSNRLMFFNQLIIARKINDRFSVQVAPSLTHVNSVQGYYPGDTTSDGKSVVGKEMLHDHFAIAISGKIALTSMMNLLIGIDQPLTKHKTNNPNPNMSVALEMNTSAHTFQIIIGNYHYMTPSRNNYYNHNDYTDGQFLIGFNMTRLWNF